MIVLVSGSSKLCPRYVHKLWELPAVGGEGSTPTSRLQSLNFEWKCALNFNPCENFQTPWYTCRYILVAYIMQCVVTADCLFTSQSVWQRWVECSELCGVSGHWTSPLRNHDIYPASTPLRLSVAGVTRGWERQRGSKPLSYRLTAPSECWLLRPLTNWL